jgi:hypothetical protein
MPPLSPKELHQLNVGSGNYNCYAPLQPPPAGRSRIKSFKCKLDADPGEAPLKTPKLDRNVVFEQLKASDEAMISIKDSFNDALLMLPWSPWTTSSPACLLTF